MPFPPPLPGPLVPPSKPNINQPFPSPSVPSLPKPEFPNGGLIPSPGNEIGSLDFENIIGGPLVAAINAQATAAMTTVEFIKQVGFQNPSPQNTSQTGDAQKSDPGAMEPVYVTFKYPKEVMPYQPTVPGGLVGITVIDSGEGYTSAPKIEAEGVQGAILTAEMDGDKIGRIIIKEAGTGWQSNTKVLANSTGETQPGKVAKLSASVREFQEAKPAVYDTMALQVPILTMLPVPYLRIEEMELEFDVQINQIEKVDVKTTVGMNERMGVGGQGAVSGIGGAAKFSASISMQTKGSYSNEIKRKYSMNVKIKAVQPEMPQGLERILGILEKSILAQPVSALMPSTSPNNSEEG